MKLIILMFTFSVSILGYAQEYKPFRHLNVSVNGSTMGAGLEVATPINDYFNLRLGYSGFSMSFDDTFEIDNEELREKLSYSPDYKFNAKASLNHGHLLVDFTPARRGLFHFTAGVFLGETKFQSNGLLINPNTGTAAVDDLPKGESWPTIGFDKYSIEIREDGSIPATLKLGNTIKPYFGIGLGRAVTNNRIGFKFELGVLYQGEYQLTQNNKKVSLDRSGESDDSFDDVKDIVEILKWWPMMNFQLTYRIF